MPNLTVARLNRHFVQRDPAWQFGGSRNLELEQSKAPMKTIFSCLAATCALLNSTSDNTAFAQSYPTRPIQIIAPFTPGGGVDFSARIIALKLPELTGQQVIVQNVTGASGNIGAERVAKSPADGYMLLLGSSPNAVAMTLFKHVSYDFVKDFVAIILIGSNAQILVINPVVPATTVTDIIKLARKNPGVLTYGSAGAGTASHLGGEMLGLSNNIRLVHVPYKGVSAALIGALSGEVDMSFATVSSAKPHIQAKRLKAIAVASPERSRVAPEVPIFDEQGVKNFYLSTWYGIQAPRGTPSEIVQRLNSDIGKLLRSPDVEKRLLEQGIEPSPGTPEAYGKYVESEVRKWGRVVREAKLQQ